jgi:hypothetical protein
MIRFGTFLAFLGFGSALLHFTSVQFRLLMWSEPMQPVLGLSIGAAGAVILLIKMLVSKDSEDEAPAGAPGQYGPPPGFAPGQQPYGAPQSYGPPSGPQPVGAPAPQPFAPQPAPQPMAMPQSYGPPAGQQSYGQPSGPQQFGPPQGYPQNGMPPAQFGPQGGQQFGPRG